MREGLVYLPSVLGEEADGRLRAEAWEVEHIRWTLWNGGPCVYSTDCAITSLRTELEMHRRAAHSAGRAVERIDCMLERLEEFRRYLYANGESLVNYNHARIAGERVSTAHVESTVNQLVNWRMCKKRQMRWSATGAQLLLHVRTADLNGRLGHYVGRAAANDATPVAIAA